VVIASIAVWVLLRSPRPTSQPLVRLDVDLPQFANPPGFVARSAVLSPDGSRLVYTGRDAAGQARLYTRLLDQDQPTPLPGTDDGYTPFFSPDGQSIGFFAKGKLKKTSVMGGGTVELGGVNNGRGGSWGEDGNIIFAADLGVALSRIPSSGGIVQPVTEVEKGGSHRWPQVLPGAQAVLFMHTTVSADTATNATIEVQSLRTGERKTLVRGGYFGRYLSSGYLVYMHQGTLYAAPMDVKRLVLTGPAVPVVEGVASSQVTAFGQVDVSSSGTLLYVKGKMDGADPPQTLLWLDGTGQTRPLRQIPQHHGGLFSFSPDGHRLAMGLLDGGNPDVWVYDWERDTITRLTFERGTDLQPVWTPDGKHIVFSSDRHGGPQNLYWMRSDGASPAVRLTESENHQIAGSFSPDGKRLAFSENETQTQVRRHLWTLTLDDVASDHPKAGKPEPFLQTAFSENWPMISPDGRWLAYMSEESGSSEIYVRTFPGPGGKWQVSSGGATGQPVWSKKAPELFYGTPEGIKVITYRANRDAFELGKSRLWTAKKGLIWYDLAPDGKRFAIAQPVAVPEVKPDTHVTFLLNFFDELRRRAPAGGNQ
jgi:Tol biopolymer transport system component